MIQGSEEAVLWLQLSEPLTVGMLGDLREKGKKMKWKRRRKTDNKSEEREKLERENNRGGGKQRLGKIESREGNRIMERDSIKNVIYKGCHVAS